MKRKWFKPFDLLIVGAVLALALFLLFGMRRPVGDTVCIYVGDALYDEIPLSEQLPLQYTVVTERGSLQLSFSAEGVAVIDSDCPDDVCVRTGRVVRAGESIVCAPLGVCITVGDGGLDGVTG